MLAPYRERYFISGEINSEVADPAAKMEEIAARFHTELKGVPTIGDSLKDLQAAEAVGAQAILVLTGKGRKTKEEGSLPKKTLVFDDLAEASRHLIAHP